MLLSRYFPLRISSEAVWTRGTIWNVALTSTWFHGPGNGASFRLKNGLVMWASHVRPLPFGQPKVWEEWTVTDYQPAGFLPVAFDSGTKRALCLGCVPTCFYDQNWQPACFQHMEHRDRCWTLPRLQFLPGWHTLLERTAFRVQILDIFPSPKMEIEQIEQLK